MCTPLCKACTNAYEWYNGGVQAQQAMPTFQQATESPTLRQARTASPAVAWNEGLAGLFACAIKLANLLPIRIRLQHHCNEKLLALKHSRCASIFTQFSRYLIGAKFIHSA